MPRDPDLYDFFVSYARSDNRDGWIEHFIHALLQEHRQFSGGRELTYFFDKERIPNFSYWETEIFNKGIARSRLFLAFLSPSYFASDVCRREWKAWIDQEIAKHILTEGAAPIYIVEVPGFISKPPLGEHEVAREVAKLCNVTRDDRFDFSVSSLVKEFRRRQLELVQPFYNAGVTALQQADIKRTLQRLAQDLDQKAEHVRRAAESDNTVPPYNEKFTGRHDELIELRRRLKDDRTGVICGIHGLGGIGKTELAYTYAHAFAGVYAGGRFLVRCEGESDLKQALLRMEADPFHNEITDEERKDPRAHFAAILRALRNRLDEKGHVLLVLDNVDNPDLVSRQRTDAVTVLGPQLHLLATTRLPPPVNANWLTLGELSRQEALDLLNKFRPIRTEEGREGAESIVAKLGGFALAIELVAAGLSMHPSATYSSVAAGLGLGDLDTLAEDDDVELRRHNHEKRLRAVLEPTLMGLSQEERRVLEYGAFLPSDRVPLPWLKALVIREFPELEKATKWGTPWDELLHRLVRLGLMSCIEEESTSMRQVRVHRLVQQFVRANLTVGDRNALESGVFQLIAKRVDALTKSANWQEAGWELDPLDAIARMWDEANHPGAAWLLNQVGVKWCQVAQWSRAEPLLRRAVMLDELSYGPNHRSIVQRLSAVAQLCMSTGRLGEAEDLIRRALAIAEVEFGQSHPLVANLINSRAALLLETDKPELAEPLFERALAICEAAFGADSPDVAPILNNLASLRQELHRLDDAEKLFRRVLAIYRAAHGSDNINVAKSLCNLGNLLHEKSQLDEAESLLRQAVSIYAAHFGASHPSVALAINNLATVLQENAQWAEAETLMRRSCAIYEASYGTDHPNIAMTLNNLAMLLHETNRLSEAEALLRRALMIYEANYGRDHPKVAKCLNNLSGVLLESSSLVEADELARRALSIHERSYGPDHPDLALNLNQLGLVLKESSRLEDAEPLFRRALKIDELSYGQNHPRVANRLSNLALLLLETHRWSDAEPLLRKALEIDERAFGPNHLTVARDLKNLGWLLKLTARFEEAESAMLRGITIFLESARKSGHVPAKLRVAIDNYSALIEATGRSEEEAREITSELVTRYGVTLN